VSLISNKKKHAYSGFRFLVEIQGKIVGGFSEVSDLQAETEVETIEEGGVNDYVHRLPKTKYSNVTLQKGLANSEVFGKWHQSIVEGNITKKSVYITLTSVKENEKWRWCIIETYPIKWTGPQLKAQSNSLTVDLLFYRLFLDAGVPQCQDVVLVLFYSSCFLQVGFY
jgi:phage tail-like protein